MLELFRKEDPNLKRNREAQQLREMQQVWKKNLGPDGEPLRPLRKRVPRVLLFRNSNCSDVRGGFFKEPFTLSRLLPLHRFYTS